VTIELTADQALRVERRGRVHLLDLHPPDSSLVEDALEGLAKTPRTLSPKYFYDERGSALFEAITRLPEYYPTRTEIGILEAHLPSIAEAVGPNAWVVEFGCGSALKTQRLLHALDTPVGIALVDISRSALLASAQAIAARFTALDVVGVLADFTQELRLPSPSRAPARRVAFFPGSTIGNFARPEATAFVRRVSRLVGPGGALLLGVDRVKEPSLLEAAYDDAQGVTAAFNQNVLRRLNAAGADFDLEAFVHRAPWVAREKRIEMHLVSTRAQTVTLAGRRLDLAEGESICTEHCHKFELSDVAALAEAAGMALTRTWSDPRSWFSVCLLERPWES